MTDFQYQKKLESERHMIREYICAKD